VLRDGVATEYLAVRAPDDHLERVLEEAPLASADRD
jgi:hypothetical protein